MQDGGTRERSNDTYRFESIQILLSNKRWSNSIVENVYI